MEMEILAREGQRLQGSSLTHFGGLDMLVLSRNEHERICIGENIWIEAVECSRGRVRIGITAPEEVLIRREELITNTDKKSK